MMSRRTSTILIIAILAAALLPMAAMIALSFRGPDGGFSLNAYETFVVDGRQAELLRRSVTVSATAALLALLMGLPVGYAMARLPRPLALVIAALCPIPLLIPSIVNALGWIGLLGSAGSATATLQNMLNTSQPPAIVAGEFGASLLLALCYFPCVALTAFAAFRALDAGQWDAARLAASPGRVFFSLTLRRIAGPILAGVTLTFLLAFGDFGVPSVLGVNVYPVEVFTYFNAFHDFSGAVVRCIPSILVALIVAIPLATFNRNAVETWIGERWKPVERRTSGLRAALLFVVAFAIAGGASLLPLSNLVATCGSWENVRRAMTTASTQVIAGFETAFPAAVILLILGLLFAAALRETSPPLRRTALTILIVTLVIPGAVTGMGLLLLRREHLIPDGFYEAGGTLIVADVVRYLAIPAVILWQAVAAVARGVEAPAVLAGAGVARRWRSIMIPLCASSLIAAFMLSLAFAVGELGASVLAAPPGMMTVPARICSLLHFGEESLVAALSLIVCLLALLPYLFVVLVPRRSWEART